MAGQPDSPPRSGPEGTGTGALATIDEIPQALPPGFSRLPPVIIHDAHGAIVVDRMRIDISSHGHIQGMMLDDDMPTFASLLSFALFSFV